MGEVNLFLFIHSNRIEKTINYKDYVVKTNFQLFSLHKMLKIKMQN